jgi:hypothetical protein
MVLRAAHQEPAPLLEGETLKEGVRRGPYTSKELFEIAVQVADALEAAQRNYSS